MKIDREAFTSYLGEGTHTAFRKAADCAQADMIWACINDMPDTEWHSVLVFISDAMVDALEAGAFQK